MNSFAGLVLLITGESAPALAAIAKVQGGLAGLQGSVAETNKGSFFGGLAKIGTAAVAALGIATVAVTAFGLEAAKKLIDVGTAAFEMSEKFGIAKGRATEWMAVGTALGVSSTQIGTAFKFLGRNLESIDLLNNTAKQKELAKEQKIWADAIRQADKDLQSANPKIRAHAAEVKAAAEAKIEDARAALAAADANRPFAAIMDQLGIATHDATGKIRDENDVMLDIADAFQKMPDGADKAGMAMKLFGRSGVEMIPILNQGRAGIEGLIAKAKEMGATMTDSQVVTAYKAGLAMHQLTLAWQGATSMLGLAFLPMLTGIAAFMTNTGIPAAEKFGEWLGPKLGAAASQVGSALVAAWPSLQKFGQGFLDAWPSVVRIAQSLGQDLLPILRTALPMVGSAAMFLSSLLAPALKLVADNMEILKPILYTLVVSWALWNTTMAVTNTIGVLTSLPATIAKLIPAMLGLSGALDVLGISEAVAFWPLLAVVAIIAGVILIGVLLIGHWKQISTTVHDLGVLLGTFFVEVWNKVRDAVGGFFSGVGSKVQSGLKAIGDAFSRLGTTAHNIWDAIVKTVENAARAFWERPFYWITRVVLFIPGLLFQLQVRIGQWAKDVAMHAAKAGGDFFNNLGTWLSKLPGWIATWALGLLVRFLKWREDTIKAATDAALGVWNALTSWFGKLPNAVWGFLVMVVSNVVKWAADMKTQVANVAQGVWDAITTMDWLQLGKSILEGIINGMKNIVGWAVSQAKGTANDIVQGIKDAFGAHSPATATIPVGRSVIEGIAKGMADNSGLAERALANLVGSLGSVRAVNRSAQAGSSEIEGLRPLIDRHHRGGGLSIGSMTVNNPASELDLITALQRAEWLARMKERGIAPAVATA